MSQAYTNHGQILEMNLQPEEAIIDLDKAIKLYPGDSRPLETRGLARILMEDFNGAIADFDFYLTNEKYNIFGKALVYADRSFAKLMLGKRVEADQDLQVSLKLAAKSAPIIEDRLKELSAQLTLMRQLRAKNRLIGLVRKPRLGAQGGFVR